MQMSSLQINGGQIGFGEIDAGEVGPGAVFSARFHPLLVLIQDFGQIDKRNSDRAFSARWFLSGWLFLCRLNDRDPGLQFFDFFDGLGFWSHSNTFPRQISFAHKMQPGGGFLRRIRATPAPTFEFTMKCRWALQSSRNCALKIA